MIFFLALLEAVWTFFFVIFFALFIKKTRSIDVFHRLRHYYDKNAKNLQKTEDFILRIYRFIKKVSEPLANWKGTKTLDFKLKQAGVPLLGHELIVLSILGAVLSAAVMYMITLNGTAAPLVGISLPSLLWVGLAFLIKRRRALFTEQLGDCLTTVANALRAGYSFQQAMDVVAKEMEPPISTEFERVMTDIAMGVTLEDALEQMNNRVGSTDFDLVVTAVLIQREVGGNLAQILDTISDTINERIRMKREIKALTAQGRFSSWILILLPFAVAVFCWIFNHDQMQVFVEEEAGHIAVAAAIIMEIVGFILIQNIVDIEV